MPPKAAPDRALAGMAGGKRGGGSAVQCSRTRVGLRLGNMLSACTHLALQVVSQLLEEMGEPQRLSPTETELEREQRLLKRTCNLKFMTWFDGSPILNRSWTTH